MEFLGVGKPVNLIQPIVSVLIPAYQHVKYIEECLNSVLNQETIFPYEILIGEDDSNDGTRELCISYAKDNQDKIRLFLRNGKEKISMFGRKSGRLNHLGLYGSARGKFICICDGDDFWIDKYKLQKQVEILEKYQNVSLCISNTLINGKKGQLQLPESFHLFSKNELKRNNYLGHISGWMMRNFMRDFLQNPIISKPVVLDRSLFAFQKNKGDIIAIPDYTSYYRIHSNGVYQSQHRLKNNRLLYKSNWYLFRYIHKDLTLLVRSMLYTLRREFVILFSILFKRS
ncbi:glycosyltransferase family 2 protein [Algoriphagus limi]|uniref:Glycosyltransferase n=1 Tax=Algoriphagus limi TaxID=2975273 RepID=A0ABT2G519_9BACT|nr:glycosyltransferase [Algoriphagus limi]MCS5490370.1 glycosyltransferase [Algoriphagus limi]